MLELDELLDFSELLLESGDLLLELDDDLDSSDELLPSDSALELLNPLLFDGALLLD